MNNPGNIRHGDQWQGMSADQPDASFVKFKTPEYGIRAMGKILLQYRKRGIDTVREIIRTWAPPNENNTPAYVASVCRSCGFGPDETLNLDDVSVMRPLIKAIITHENGQQPYSDAQIEAGLRMAGIVNAKPPPVMKDKTIVGTAVTTVSVAATGVKEASDNIEWLREMLLPLAGYLPSISYALLALGLVGIAVAAYGRWKERR